MSDRICFDDVKAFLAKEGSLERLKFVMHPTKFRKGRRGTWSFPEIFDVTRDRNNSLRVVLVDTKIETERLRFPCNVATNGYVNYPIVNIWNESVSSDPYSHGIYENQFNVLRNGLEMINIGDNQRQRLLRMSGASIFTTLFTPSIAKKFGEMIVLRNRSLMSRFNFYHQNKGKNQHKLDDVRSYDYYHYLKHTNVNLRALQYILLMEYEWKCNNNTSAEVSKYRWKHVFESVSPLHDGGFGSIYDSIINVPNQNLFHRVLILKDLTRHSLNHSEVCLSEKVGDRYVLYVEPARDIEDYRTYPITKQPTQEHIDLFDRVINHLVTMEPDLFEGHNIDWFWHQIRNGPGLHCYVQPKQMLNVQVRHEMIKLTTLEADIIVDYMNMIRQTYKDRKVNFSEVNLISHLNIYGHKDHVRLEDYFRDIGGEYAKLTSHVISGLSTLIAIPVMSQFVVDYIDGIMLEWFGVPSLSNEIIWENLSVISALIMISNPIGLHFMINESVALPHVITDVSNPLESFDMKPFELKYGFIEYLKVDWRKLSPEKAREEYAYCLQKFAKDNPKVAVGNLNLTEFFVSALKYFFLDMSKADLRETATNTFLSPRHTKTLHKAWADMDENDDNEFYNESPKFTWSTEDATKSTRGSSGSSSTSHQIDDQVDPDVPVLKINLNGSSMNTNEVERINSK